MKHNPALLLELARRHSGKPGRAGGRRFRRHRRRLAAQAKPRKPDLANLLILPYQPFADLPSVLATGDVLVGILEEEAGVFSVPSKTLSYLCAGRPLLLAIPPENLAARITRDNQAGLTVAPADMDGFLAAARQLHASPGLRARMARSARTYAEETFPIEKTAAVFDEILAK